MLGPPLEVCDDSRVMAVDSSIVLAVVEGSVSATRCAPTPTGSAPSGARLLGVVLVASSPTGRRPEARQGAADPDQPPAARPARLGPDSGGVATVATSYVRDQVERGWNVTVACPSRGDLGYAAREAGAAVRWWRAVPHGGALPGEVVRLGRIVAEIEPDVVHLHSAKAGLAGRLVVRDRIPTVFQPHAWSFLDAASGVQGASLRWERYAARWTTELVCVSTTERQLGESLGVHAPTTVLPNGIDLTGSARPGPATGSGAQGARAGRRPDRAVRRRADRAEGPAGPARGLAAGAGPGAGGPAGAGRGRPGPPGARAARRGASTG